MTAPTPPLSAEARLAALRQDLEALAEEWEAEVARGRWCGECFAPDDERNELRAVLAEHATPSDDTAAMWIDPNPPGVTPLPPEQAREILDALDGADAGQGERVGPISRQRPVRLTEGEVDDLLGARVVAYYERGTTPPDGQRAVYIEAALRSAVERILAARLRAATEGKGEA